LLFAWDKPYGQGTPLGPILDEFHEKRVIFGNHVDVDLTTAELFQLF
jgi:hypothetical protein